jgi:hypothetical protein
VSEKPVIRRSMAEGLMTCPDYRLEQSEVLAFGRAFHLFVADYWRHLQAIGEESDLNSWELIASEAWARTPGLRQSRFGEYRAKW